MERKYNCDVVIYTALLGAVILKVVNATRQQQTGLNRKEAQQGAAKQGELFQGGETRADVWGGGQDVSVMVQVGPDGRRQATFTSHGPTRQRGGQVGFQT